MPSNRRRPINRPGRASGRELLPIPTETPLERFEMLGARLANPDLEMVDHPYAGLQRSAVVEQVEYKGKNRQLSIIGVFAISATQEVSFTEARVELFSLTNHKTKRHSKVERVEVDLDPEDNPLPDNALRKLHKDLNLIECGVMAVELNQGIIHPKLVVPFILAASPE